MVIMPVLSRQQLFTESTITAVLPVAAEFTWTNIGRMTRLGSMVLAADLAGTLFAALRYDLFASRLLLLLSPHFSRCRLRLEQCL